MSYCIAEEKWNVSELTCCVTWRRSSLAVSSTWSEYLLMTKNKMRWHIVQYYDCQTKCPANKNRMVVVIDRRRCWGGLDIHTSPGCSSSEFCLQDLHPSSCVGEVGDGYASGPLISVSLQYWRALENFELCVVDCGRGVIQIRETVKNTEYGEIV